MNVRKNTDYSELFAMLDQAMQSELPEMKLYFMIGSCVGSRQEKALLLRRQSICKRSTLTQRASPHGTFAVCATSIWLMPTILLR